MKACSYCGVHNNPDATLCSECGLALPFTTSGNPKQPELSDRLGRILDDVLRGRSVQFRDSSRRLKFKGFAMAPRRKAEISSSQPTPLTLDSTRDKTATMAKEGADSSSVAIVAPGVPASDSPSAEPKRSNLSAVLIMKIALLVLIVGLIGWRCWQVKKQSGIESEQAARSYQIEHRANLLRGVSISALPYGQKQGRTLAMLVTTERFSLSSERSKLELANIAESQWYEYRASEKGQRDISVIKAMAECSDPEVEQAWVDGFVTGVKLELQPVLDRNRY